jgi:NAD(P)-dependent dehydrogenase (short-subunit alcohol dehydrogenase family)
VGQAKEAAARILSSRPHPAPPASVQAVRLDLASLASVREAAEEIGSAYGPVDLLINNAGVMMTPYRRTDDGLELQLGVNHLGHFALTGLLLGRPLGQSAAMGALATLRAAADPAARGGEYYGPGGRGELRGYPRLVASTERARDVEAQKRLWQESERLTGVSYPV